MAFFRSQTGGQRQNGLDEHTVSARVSRYESGVHELPIKTVHLIARVLGNPMTYLY